MLEDVLADLQAKHGQLTSKTILNPKLLLRNYQAFSSSLKNLPAGPTWENCVPLIWPGIRGSRVEFRKQSWHTAH